MQSHKSDKARGIFLILATIMSLSVSCKFGGQPFVKIIDNVADESAGNLNCYKIESSSATYYLEKEGLGLSSMIDIEGVDWISFDPTPGTGSDGEYRGFPNAVYKQDGSFFHPKNEGTTPSTSEILLDTSEKITIKGISGNGTWECLWDFYPTHCNYTMTKMPEGFAYWILYEGTPGGSLDTTDWWMTSAINEKQPVALNHEGDIPAPEWIAFGDHKMNRSLFLVNHKDDGELDTFFQMQGNMTVFGFGRKDLNLYFKEVPRIFSIGFVESDDHSEISNKINELIW